MKTRLITQFVAIVIIATVTSFSSVIASGSFYKGIADKISTSADIASLDTSEIALMSNGVNFNMFLKDNISYPSIAVEREIEGSVRVLCKIGTDGLVKDVKVLSAVDEVLANEVTKAARELSFIPATQNGFAVSYSIIIPVKFHLR